MKILFLCDGKACEQCDPDCRHTTKIEHAANFEKVEYADGRYVEFIENEGTDSCKQLGIPER